MWLPTEEEKQVLAENPHVFKAETGRFSVEVEWLADEFHCRVLLDGNMKYPIEELKTPDAEAMMSWMMRQMKEAAKRSPKVEESSGDNVESQDVR